MKGANGLKGVEMIELLKTTLIGFAFLLGMVTFICVLVNIPLVATIFQITFLAFFAVVLSFGFGCIIEMIGKQKSKNAKRSE